MFSIIYQCAKVAKAFDAILAENGKFSLKCSKILDKSGSHWPLVRILKIELWQTPGLLSLYAFSWLGDYKIRMETFNTVIILI